MCFVNSAACGVERLESRWLREATAEHGGKKNRGKKVQVVLILCICSLRKKKRTLERCTGFSLGSVKTAFEKRVSADP